MTNERLADIRAWREHVPMQTVDIYTLTGHRLELLAEVDRLRAIECGVESLADEWSKPSPYDGHGMRAPIDPDHAARRLRNLLNPTEGDNDDCA